MGTIQCQGIDYWDFKRKLIFFERNPFKGQSTIAYSREDKRFDHQKLKNHPKDTLIISFEGKDINQMNTMIDNDHDNLVGASAKIYCIIILRDPFNLFTSIYKKWGKEYLIKFIKDN